MENGQVYVEILAGPDMAPTTAIAIEWERLPNDNPPNRWVGRD